jgi:hypothetical protein
MRQTRAIAHCVARVDVVGGDRKVVTWGFETGGVNALDRRGWRKAELLAGTVVVIDGWRCRAKNGPPTANAYCMTLPNGRRLFAGTSSANASGGGQAESNRTDVRRSGRDVNARRICEHRAQPSNLSSGQTFVDETLEWSEPPRKLVTGRRWYSHHTVHSHATARACKG